MSNPTKCAKCEVLVFDVPLMRVNKKGVPGIWWCEPCVKKHEPELYRNEKEDETPIEDLLKQWSYGKSFKR